MTSSRTSFGRPGCAPRIDAESDTAALGAGAEDQPWSRSAATSFWSVALVEDDDDDATDESAALEARRLSPNGFDVDGLSRFGARSAAPDTATPLMERDEAERATPARFPMDDDEADGGSVRFLAAQCVAIESILSNPRLWLMSNAALLPLLGEAGLHVDEDAKRDELLRGSGAVARDSAARRFISARILSIADPVDSDAVTGSAQAEADAVELVEAKREPGIEVKVKADDGGAAVAEGEPKTKHGDAVGSDGPGESTEAMLVSASVERDETRRMPPSSWPSSALCGSSWYGGSAAASSSSAAGEEVAETPCASA